MRTTRRGLGNEQGSVLVLVAVTLVGVLAFAAFAIDLASLRDTKGEAQRAADAIALAGASAFRDFPWVNDTTSDSAWGRGLAIARLNQVRADTLDIRIVDSGTSGPGRLKWVKTRDVWLNVIPDSQKVRVWVWRAGIRTSFAKLLGVPFGNVQAMATAWASNSGPTVNCLKPFLLPDMWQESSATEDLGLDKNMHTDPNPANPPENWTYDSTAGDRYVPFDPSVPANPLSPQTGYGSGFRDPSPTGYPADVGLPLQLMPPGDPAVRQGYFALDNPRGTRLDQQISDECLPANVGDTPDLLSAPDPDDVTRAVQNILNRDPGATWNQSAKQVTGSTESDWTKSPRVITVALMDPRHIHGANPAQQPDGRTEFSNFARIWLDQPEVTDPPGTVRAVFLGFATGTSGGTTSGTLVKQLQLIE